MDNSYEVMVKAILDRYCDPLINKATKSIKTEWEKIKIDLHTAFKEYLQNGYKKYSKIKTILYRTEPKDIYNFFECPILEKEDNGFQILADNINKLLELSNFLIIQGTGGMGKSTLMKHLFLNEINHEDFIPIFIELKNLNNQKEDYEVNDLIFDALSNLGSKIDHNGLEYALQSGCFLFLLDGYDEISSDKRDAFFKKFDTFCDRYSNNKYIISTRPYSDFIEFQRFTILKIRPFNQKQVISLIGKIEYDEDIKERFIKDMNRTLYHKHTSFVSNPLLLTIMLITFDNFAEIPQKLHLFYDNAFETLYCKHDATKAGYRRELKSELPYDTFKKVFSDFCFITYCQEKIEFTESELTTTLKKVMNKLPKSNVKNFIYDLVNSVCVLYKEGLNYKFSHRSFQEYFTAVFLKEQSDDNMTKIALPLIEKHANKVRHDSVFDMLFDMAEERVEQNILLPLLKETEKECSKEDKYDFYLSKINPIIRLRPSELAEDKISVIYMIYPHKIIEKPILFIYQFVNFYIDDKMFISKSSKTSKLIKQLVQKEGYQVGETLNGKDYFGNKDIYMAFKDTYLGYKIQTIANLSNYLSNKQKEKDADLSNLLSEYFPN